jgi:two-component system response regulator FixJ
VVVVTGHGDVPLAVRAMRAGAADFVEKPFGRERILSAIAEASERGAAAARSAALVASLTPREREVLAGLVAGKANKAIAGDLGISARTVEAHRAVIMEKLGARSLPELVRTALAAGVGF